MKTRSMFALLSAMLLPLFTFAADLVAKFDSFESGATSGAFTVGGNGRTITSDGSWLVADGVTVVLEYSGFVKTAGASSLISFKQSNKDQKNLIGIGTSNGLFYGVYNGGLWSSSPIGSTVPESGTMVFSYNNNGVVVYTVADGSKTQVFASTGLKETKDGFKLGTSFDIGALNSGTLDAGITVSKVLIYNGSTAADDVVAVATSDSEDITLPNGTYTVSHVLSGSGAVTVDAGTNGEISLSAANTFTGGLTVKSGTAKQTITGANSHRGFGPNNVANNKADNLARITIESGATLDYANTQGACYSITSEGTITNSGNAIGPTERQATFLTLFGDTTVSGNQFGLLGPGYAATTLDLDEHTLIVNMASAMTTFILCNTTISGSGKIRLEQGKLYLKKTITGTLNIDLPAVPEDGATLFSLDNDRNLTNMKLNVTVDGEALPANVKVSAEGVVSVASESGAVVEKNGAVWRIDTTDGIYVFSADEINYLKSNYTIVYLNSSSDKGATIDFGDMTGLQQAHFIFESGRHALKWKGNSASMNFGNAADITNPCISVKNGAILDFYAKDVTGWQSSASNAAKNIFRVFGGGKVFLHKNGDNTFFFAGLWYLEPGAEIEADDFQDNKVCLSGGIDESHPQIHVISPTGENKSVTYRSNVGFRFPKDNPKGYGIQVDENSTLILEGDVSSIANDCHLGKFGEGALEITGSLSGFTGEIQIAAGSIKVKKTCGLAAGKVVQFEEDDEKEIKVATEGEWVIYTNEPKIVFNPDTDTVATTPVLRFSEIMPKPSDKPNSITTEAGYDKNGLESGWVELENTSETEWADLADYKFIRTNRSKANDKGDYGAFPSVKIPPSSKYVFYTSERYSNSASKADSAFAEGTFDGKPMYFEKYDMMIWGDKINPKKFPFVRLYFKDTTIVDTVVIPSDIPEGNSIIVTPVEEGKATVRYMTNKPTKGAANTALDDASIVKLGPNAGPLYEISTGKKHNSASEFARVAAPAVSTNDYEVVFSMNPTMSPTEMAKFRAEDAITKIDMIVRTDLDDKTLTTIPVDLTTKTNDAKDWGDNYTATIPLSLFPEEGHLIQWKFKVTDQAGNEWTTPSFHNPDDGYEWYGTIVESEELTSKSLPTWHMFADAASVAQMDIDTDKQNLNVVPHNARVAIYDSSTSNYYDYVRIDLRGNTSASFKKKSHGLRFAKAHPLTMVDIVASEGETVVKREEVRKSSLIGEPADPSRMRQMMAFWLWNKMGNKVPFDFPVRCNLNGEFFQLGFHSERFTDELIEDFHKLDKYGYGYKNVGTLASGSGTTAGGIEKKTPDDGNESDISVLQDELRAPLKSRGIDTLNASNNEELPAVTKFVVEKFDLPAWLNYLASARITQEMDDVWANISIYYDNAQMLEGARGTGTWMPLGYDFNLTFGQWYINDVQGATRTGMYMVNQDWFKSHPFYGGNVVRCYKQEAMTTTCNEGNRAIEAVWQSPKFRRLYLRRLRTLMDQELGAPNEEETLENTTIPVMVKMKEIAELMRADANEDTTTYPWDSTIGNIDIWGSSLFPKTMDAGIEEIWTKYIVPRRQHLYVTHAAEGHAAEEIGYGTKLCAGIPAAQSPIADLKEGLSAEYDSTIGAVIIKNTNHETIDLSGWNVGGPVQITLPAGTVIDQGSEEEPAEVYVSADRRTTVAAMTLVDQVVVGNGDAGAADAFVTLATDSGEFIQMEPTDQLKFVRLWGFTGAPQLADEDWGEAIVLTNLNQEAAIDLGGMDFNFCGSDKLDTASKCHFTLVEGVTLPAGGFLRIKKTDTTLFTVPTAWDKIANHGQRITIKDKNGTLIQFFELVDQDALGVYLTGLGLKYDYETSAWETISEQESPGWEDLTPPPPPPEEGEGDEETYPEDATEYSGEYAEAVEIVGGNVLFNGATFAAGLTIAADTTIYLKAGTENSASTITSSGAITIDGSGTLTINYADGEIGTAAVTFTTELPCYYIQNKGTVNLNLSSTNQVFGFYAKDLKNVVARFNGGVFNATIQGGDGSAAFKFNKGSNDLIINGTEINIALGGTAPRFANVGGHIEFTKDCGKVNVSTITGEGTNARVFKTDKKVKLNGGTILGEASGEGAEMFSAGNEINMTGGVVNVTAADDCFSAATNIVVSAGIVHAVSTAGDALDSNGSMSLTGGYVFAFTKSSEHEALDVTPSNLEGDTLEHTLTIDAGATVVAVSGKTPEVAPEGTATVFKKSFESVANKFVGFTTVTETETEKTTKSYAVSWEGKIAASPTILIAGSDLTDAKADIKNPGKDNPDYVALDGAIEKITVKTTVEEIAPPGPDYPEGALVITTPGEYTELIEGDKTVVVDVGAGNTVTFTQANSFTGGLYIYSGTAAQTYRSTNNSRFGGFGANNFDNLETMCHIYVREGATLDLANTVDASYIIHSAGTIVNSGSTIGVGSRQMTQLILDGDTTIKGNTFGIVRSGHNPATLDLGGYTLTLDMASETTQFVTAALTIMNPGVIKIKNGQFFIKADKDFAVENGAQVPLDVSAFELNTVVVSGKAAALGSFVLAEGQNGWSLDATSGNLTAVYVEPTPDPAEEDESAEEVGLMISEIMPKASVWDENHCDSGWLEVVNVSQKNVNFGDYTIARFNRGKAVEKLNKWVNNVKEKILAPGERLVIKTSEDYSHVDDKTITQYGEELGNVIVLAAKVNPKKYPMVVLVKGGKVVQRCVVPVDVPEDKSVCFDGGDLNGAKVSRICTATMGTRNALRSGIPVGPQISSLYGVADAEDYWTAFDKATVGTDYTVSVPVNPIVGGNEKNEISAVNLIYQIGWGEIVTNEVAMVKAETEDPLKGAVYSGAIPGEAIQGEGQLVRWAVKITDKAGNAWRSPSFNNPEDGFEWYGTITTPSAEQIEGGITTFHLFVPEDIADGCGTIKTKSNCLMNIDADDAAYTSNSKYPYGAYVGIYDNDTGMYYDKVRIDKRGNTSGSFTKKAHGLKFAKAQSFKGIDSVTGKEIECRKSSFTAEYADPSFVRQGLSFKTLNDNGSKAPFHYPVRLNLNGEFYQLAFHTERFSDELIEDFYGLDGKGYGYKNIGPFNPGVRPVSGGIEKKTPDDGVTSDDGVLNAFCAKMADCERISEDHTKGDPTPTADSEFETEFSKELTKVVATDFDLPAWLNYIALTKITGETDDVWANLSGYYDVNGTGTWMPLAYDMNQSFGQWHLSDDWDYDFGDKCPATDDHHKAHPLYGGLHIMVHYSGGAPYSSSNNKTSATKPYKGNRCFESIFQNAKYRRLYLRRLRTLMDAEFGGSTADQEHTPIYQRAKAMVERFSAVAAMDRGIWTDYQTQNASAGLWVFGYKPEGWTAEEGLDWMWTEYIQPRRQHLYVTHGISDPEGKGIGYGETKCAGIPAAQSATLSLRDKITAEYVAEKKAVVIRNANAETIDLSNWKLEGPVNMTLPAGTVIDQAVDGIKGELFVSFDRKATVAAFGEDLHDQIIVGNGTYGKESAAIALTAADETKVVFTPTPEYYYLRLHSFDGCTAVLDGDDGEWFALTNVSDSVGLNLEGVRVQFLKAGDEVAKMDVMLPAGTLGPNGLVKFFRNDFDSAVWDKITNNEISMTIWDSNYSVVQTASLKQKSFANYYGTLGNKTGDKIGGKFYLEATAFGETLAQADFTEVAYPSTAPETWDEVEVTEDTKVAELVGDEQGAVLVELKVEPKKIVEWAKAHSSSTKPGEAINLEAFALNCAPDEVDTKKEDFKVTITFGENGMPIVKTVEGVTLNITPVIKGKVELSDENWTEACEGAKFFKAFIDIE